MNSHNYVLTTLSENPEYFEEVIKLIEEEFHYSELQHYEKDFAPLVDPLNFENCYLFIDQESNTVVSHLAACPRTMIKDKNEIEIILIGAIATHKKFRQQNLFRQLMNHALSLHESKAGLFMLWSDLENLYEKFSFYRSGGVIETGKRNFSASERPIGYEKTKFSSLSDKDFKNIINLYKNFNEQYFFTIKREDKDWSIIKEMNSIDLFVKKNSTGDIERYFCVNKGRDLTNIVHEVSCKKPDEFNNMLKEIENFKVWLPETEIKRFPQSDIFYTAFIRIGSIEILNKFLNGVSGGKIKIQKADADSVHFDFEDNSFNVTTKDFLQYLFGPRPLVELERYALSPYIAGTDSV